MLCICAKTEHRVAIGWDLTLTFRGTISELTDTHQYCGFHLSRPGFSYHIISLKPRIWGEIRTTKHPQQSSLPPPVSHSSSLVLVPLLTRWSYWRALAVTQTALFLWCEINTSSGLIKACEIPQSSLWRSGLSFLTQILSPLPGCRGQTRWATLRMQITSSGAEIPGQRVTNRNRDLTHVSWWKSLIVSHLRYSNSTVGDSQVHWFELLVLFFRKRACTEFGWQAFSSNTDSRGKYLFTSCAWR